MIKKFIDIHCHIIPGIDDGASTIEESLLMLEIAKKDNISTIVATPHIIAGVYDNTLESINKSLSCLKQKANEINLLSGAEIRINYRFINLIEKKKLPFINDKNYFLLELPGYSLPPVAQLEKIISNLTLRKIIPIICHPERNIVIVNNHSIMERLQNYGAVFQGTAKSITEKSYSSFFKSTLKMLKKGLIQVVASDAHNATTRAPVLSEAYDKVSRLFGQDEADRLFIHNPMKIIKGDKIDYVKRNA